MNNQINSILDISRQARIAPLSPWFSSYLTNAVNNPISTLFLSEDSLQKAGNCLVEDLVAYKEQCGINTVVIGMSGGVDSALTAALFKRAGWRVIGVTMPIHQNPEETERGIEACKALGIEHRHKDLSRLYDTLLLEEADLDPNLAPNGGLLVQDTKAVKIRKGNIRARVRMITLYNLASMERGLVASTDNYSELGAGFWSLHGDVGDLSPIQAFNKSWEVPMLAKMFGVPEPTWRATPTDGLGIDAGDEAQLGATYLEWDLMQDAIQNVLNQGIGDWSLADLANELSIATDPRAVIVFSNVTGRMKASWFKRKNPVNLRHQLAPTRYVDLEYMDFVLFQPDVVKKD